MPHRGARSRTPLLLLLVQLATGAGAAGAQAHGPLPPCTTPAARVDWEEHVLYLWIRPARRDTTQLSQMYRLLLLEDLTSRLRAQLPPPDSAAAARAPAGARLPSGDGRYGPAASYASLRFVLHGDGTLGAVHEADSMRSAPPSGPQDAARRTDSLFQGDMRRTLERMSAEHAILPIPGRDSTDSVTLFLWAVPVLRADMPVKLDSTEAAYPAFALTVPRMKSAAPAGGAAPRFPEGARLRGIGGTLMMEFVVDQDGKVDTASIRDLRQPGDIPPRFERDYQAFVAAVRKAMPRMKYLPAEFMGCRVKQLVRQPFSFGFGR